MINDELQTPVTASEVANLIAYLSVPGAENILMTARRMAREVDSLREQRTNPFSQHLAKWQRLNWEEFVKHSDAECGNCGHPMKWHDPDSGRCNIHRCVPSFRDPYPACNCGMEKESPDAR